MKRRLIVVPIIGRADGCTLLIKMPAHRGVFPGQWGLPGGGVEEGERIEEALRREVREERQIEVAAGEMARYDLNEATRATLRQVGILTQP